MIILIVVINSNIVISIMITTSAQTNVANDTVNVLTY